MKKSILRIISMLALVSILASVPATAFADPGINNQIVSPNPDATVFKSNGAIEAMKAMGYDKLITMPKSESFFDEVEAKYVDAPKDHSVYMYKNLNKNKDDGLPFAFEGMRVAAVAEQEDMTCLMYLDNKAEGSAGWVETKYLVDYFPGTEVTIGVPCVSYGNYLGDVAYKWSDSNFVGTEQKFTVINEEIQDCVQFQLNYQVIDRAGAGASEVYGMREIYVNDGSGWYKVGQFDYDREGAILVTVNLEKPMDLKAVGTVALCDQPDIFFFRQAIQDVITTSE